MGLDSRVSGHIVYVTKQADTRVCKVGWASKDPAAKIRAIEKKCQVVPEVPTVSVLSSEPSEPNVPFIVRPSIATTLKKNCSCGCENRESYQEDYQEVIRQAQIVCSWLCRDLCPYNRVAQEKNLEPAWELVFGRRLNTQGREEPLSWNDFSV